MNEKFNNRREAGRLLGEALRQYANRDDVIVLGLPRGGVPVAIEVATALHAPLDVFLVRKLGVPGQEELAMGAIASGGIRVLNDEVTSALEISDAVIDAVAEKEQGELNRRERVYRLGRPAPDVQGRIVTLIDDGLATGASMLAAVAALRSIHPAQIVVAVPTAPADTCRVLESEADEVICLRNPDPFVAIGGYYHNFPQVTDLEVQETLSRAWRQEPSITVASERK